MTDEATQATRTSQRLSDKTKEFISLVVAVAVLVPALQFEPLVSMAILLFTGLPALFAAEYYSNRRKKECQ